MTAPSKPEPAPRPGREITADIVEWLERNGWHATIDLVLARDAYGRAKYGQGLSVGDGRNGVEDLAQELGDAAQYAWKAQAGGEFDERNLAPIREHVAALTALLDCVSR